MKHLLKKIFIKIKNGINSEKFTSVCLARIFESESILLRYEEHSDVVELLNELFFSLGTEIYQIFMLHRN